MTIVTTILAPPPVVEPEPIEAGPTPARPDRSHIAAVFAACRPQQWVKNGLVLAAPFTAGQLLDPRTLSRALVASGVFCLAASGTYLRNDARDVHADRQHPKKRFRPIATGEVSVAEARRVSVALAVAALAAAALLGPAMLATVAGYLLITASTPGA